MTIRADSYSSTSEVKAFTRHLLSGQTSFNSTTRPTATDLEKFIDRASGTLNNMLWGVGYNPATIRANSTAKLACDDWVTAQSVQYVELTQRGTGYSDAEGSRTGAFRGLFGDAKKFVESVVMGFKFAGLTPTVQASAGLTFTGLSTPANRSDRSDTSLVQPQFRRDQFDDPSQVDADSST